MRALFLGLLLLVVGALPAWADAHGESLRRRVELLRDSPTPSVAETPLVAMEQVAALYERRGFVLLWEDDSNRRALVRAIAASVNDGLTPQDFHSVVLSQLAERMADAPPMALRIDFDILLTDALMTLLRQLRLGKVDPVALDANWHLDRAMLGSDLIELADQAQRDGDIAALVDKARLQHPYYHKLRTVLHDYIYLANDGGWTTIPDGPTLKPGMTGLRIAFLRHRLSFGTDYVPPQDADELFFDDDLEAAVKGFQARHGLEPDGVVGPNTLAALNVPVAERIAQIRVNLERARWVLRELGDELVMVNIAGGYVRLIRGEAIVWESRVIVGKPYHQTPVFRGDMRYLVVNPTWNVTASIAKNELFPKIRRDPGYLAQHNMDLVDGSGARVDPATVDFGGRLPYRIVQRAGEDNALGRVKFMFPNRHNVYLHDTPSRTLFERAQRTFSHGCVRVQNPFELAELVLGREPDFDLGAFNAIRASTATRTINLSRPLPVVLLYWTVDPHPSGDVYFYPDVYERDGAILKALDAPYVAFPRRL
ncbi:MAG: L,D-transpeptidase family protein [Alphaproteobacteria bacterium]